MSQASAAGLNASGDAGEEKRRRVIRERLVLQPLPVPGAVQSTGLTLYRATPSSRLSEVVGDAAPYWAHPWAGGLALARHLAGHPELAAGHRVLDLGTGGGLAALSAGLAGARTVTGIDLDPWAVTAARLNAEANRMPASFMRGDVTVIDLPSADLVLVGDLFYDGGLAQRMLPLLERLAADGTVVLIGDPGRASLPTGRLRRLAVYPVTDFGLGAGKTADGGVYTL